jgi:hypothetical protein
MSTPPHLAEDLKGYDARPDRFDHRYRSAKRRLALCFLRVWKMASSFLIKRTRTSMCNTSKSIYPATSRPVGQFARVLVELSGRD